MGTSASTPASAHHPSSSTSANQQRQSSSSIIPAHVPAYTSDSTRLPSSESTSMNNNLSASVSQQQHLHHQQQQQQHRDQQGNMSNHGASATPGADSYHQQYNGGSPSRSGSGGGGHYNGHYGNASPGGSIPRVGRTSGTAMRDTYGDGGRTCSAPHLHLNRPEAIDGRVQTFSLSYNTMGASSGGSSLMPTRSSHGTLSIPAGIKEGLDLGGLSSSSNAMMVANNHRLPTLASTSHGASSLCLNPASEINSRLDTQVEIKVYPCNNSSHSGGRKKCTQFIVKPEGVIIQGTNRPPSQDIGTEYSRHIGRKLPRYELSDTRASQLLITSHNKNYYVVPAPEAFSRHSGTCRLLGDRKHNPCNHTLKVGDFLRVGSVGVVVIETHNGVQHDVMSEDRIQRIMQDTTVGGYVDAEETDVEDSSDIETAGAFLAKHAPTLPPSSSRSVEFDAPTCYMCFDDEDTEANPLISPCKCKGDTQFVHVDCLRKWHTAEADNQVCFLSTVDATCSVCKSTFKSDFRLKSGQLVKLFQSSLEPPYVSLLIATKHEMAQRLFNTRFQLSFKTLMKPDGKNATRPLLLGRSSGSDMVLDYRTVSARHATIKLKNGEFIFADAGSSNGSYLYVRQPVELCPNAPSVQFRLGRSMISMKVVNKWNRRLLRAVTRRSGGHTPTFPSFGGGSSSSQNGGDDQTPHVNDGVYNFGEKKTRESIMSSMPNLGMLDQQSNLHLDLIFALAIPKREVVAKQRASSIEHDMLEGKTDSGEDDDDDDEEHDDVNFNMTQLRISESHESANQSPVHISHSRSQDNNDVMDDDDDDDEEDSLEDHPVVTNRELIQRSSMDAEDMSPAANEGEADDEASFDDAQSESPSSASEQEFSDDGPIATCNSGPRLTTVVSHDNEAEPYVTDAMVASPQAGPPHQTHSP